MKRRPSSFLTKECITGPWQVQVSSGHFLAILVSPELHFSFKVEEERPWKSICKKIFSSDQFLKITMKEAVSAIESGSKGTETELVSGMCLRRKWAVS